MLDFVLDSFRGEIFDFKFKRRVLVASTVIVDWDGRDLNVGLWSVKLLDLNTQF